MFYRRFIGIIKAAARVPSWCLIGMVRVYILLLSPFLGGHCRFHPSCSVYFIEAVRKYGAIRGSLKGIWRLIRCNPLSRGGFDPP